MSKDRSKHRHISFTAHYTGYIWYKMGISHPALATSKGKLLAHAVNPVERLSEHYIGGSMRSTLKQRHQILDESLERLIQVYPKLQILEIASGLSPRGWSFRKKFPEINYRELDLPDMAKIKTEALKDIDSKQPEVLTADIFSADFEKIFQFFDPQYPLAIISEGLINYFDLKLLKALLQNIVNYTHNFSEIHYFSDIYPEPTQNKFSKLIWQSSKLLKFMSRSDFTFHFSNPQEIKDFFAEEGFQTTEILQPKTYFITNANVLNPDNEHLGDLVWVIHSVIKHE